MKHKVDWGPGFRIFKCECGHNWKEASRHCESPSVDRCSECSDDIPPYSYEKHYEWETDSYGNLKKENNLARTKSR